MATKTAVTEGPQQPSEILIGDRLYDVTGFKHPGGSILKFMQGSGDATEAFGEFHSRSTKAKKQLACLPNRPAPPMDGKTNPVATARWKAMSKDLAALRAELVRDGWFTPSLPHVTYRIAELVVMHVVGVYLLLHTTLWLPALAILGIAQGRCGWLMHEGGHHSLTGNIRIDHRLQEMLYGVGCGMSGAWWRTQHNKHHATPQKLKHDVDLDTLPLVAFNAAIAKLGKKSGFMRFWIPLQAYTFAPLTCLLVSMTWQFLLHPRHMIRTKRHAELMWLGVRYALMTAVAMAAHASFATAAGAFLLYDFFGGAYIFTNFALSHTHLDVTPADAHVHWLEYAGTYTINITNSYMVNWWMAYLNFQIEHHLFPSMPQYRFPRLAPRIQALFKRHGVKYDVRGYWEAMSDTFANLDHVGKAVK